MKLIDLFMIRFPKVISMLIVFLGNSNQTPTCNSFPKIFGSSRQHSSLYHIDVFAYYLAFVGHTYDTALATVALTSGPLYPYIAVASVAIPDKYHWAKILSLKSAYRLVAV
jgi:hypothetical protein